VPSLQLYEGICHCRAIRFSVSHGARTASLGDTGVPVHFLPNACGALDVRSRRFSRLRGAHSRSAKRIAMTSDVESGTPIEYVLPKHKLSLLINVGDLSTYVLTVSLTPLASPAEVSVKGTFNGSLVDPNVGPLEFDVARGIRVSGAIALSLVGQ
jgi:hypothetical protein